MKCTIYSLILCCIKTVCIWILWLVTVIFKHLCLKNNVCGSILPFKIYFRTYYPNLFNFILPLLSWLSQPSQLQLFLPWHPVWLHYIHQYHTSISQWYLRYFASLHIPLFSPDEVHMFASQLERLWSTESKPLWRHKKTGLCVRRVILTITTVLNFYQFVFFLKLECGKSRCTWTTAEEIAWLA